MRIIRFSEPRNGLKDVCDQVIADADSVIIHRRDAPNVVELIREAARTPVEGTGKPEPLKGDLSGYWSRRIDRKHRVVYQAND